MKEIIVIGGGPSGMMAAISAKKHHSDAHVTLIDGNQRLGTKLRLTGGGRCNVCANVSNDVVIKNVPKNGKFLYSSLNQFGPQEIISFFEKRNCPLKEEDHFRMFPKSNQSRDIVNTLEQEMKDLGVEIKLGKRIAAVDFFKKNISFIDGGSCTYDHLILATGGKTLAGSGSDGFMHTCLESVHTITEMKPAEVPLVSSEQVIQEKTLQGLSFNDVSISVYKNNRVIQTITHDLLFTHFGLSGPAALRASFAVLKVLEKQRPVKITIDFVPAYSFEQLNEILAQNAEADLGLPKRLLAYLQSISQNNQALSENIKRFPLLIHETRGFAHAFLTNGGVSLKEVDPKTMRSKRVDGLSMCGELLDYNAYTGGFNITCALSTGYVAGKCCLDAN